MIDPHGDANATGSRAARGPPGGSYSTTFSGGLARTSLSASASM
jgi:hypothetical protein